MIAAWLGTIVGLIALVLVVVGPLAAHFSAVPGIIGLQAMLLGLALGLITLIFGLLGFFIRLRRGPGRFPIVFSLVTGVVLSGILIGLFVHANGYPPINDITTNVANPPKFVHAPSLPANQGRKMAYNANFGPVQKASYPTLAPLVLSMPPDQAFARVRAVAGEMPRWRITYTDPKTHTLEAVATTPLFHFHDDVVIQVRPDGNMSMVEMRSKSRVGIGDIGQNYKRIEAFFSHLSPRMASRH